MLHDGSIRREESLSRIAFKNAVKCYTKMGLVKEVELPDDEGTVSKSIVPGDNFAEREGTEERIRDFLPDSSNTVV